MPEGYEAREPLSFRIRDLRPQLAEWCAELCQLGVPATLDHADVHPGNVFAAAGVPFDWGDFFPCFLGHPLPAAHAARSLAALLRPDPLAPGA